MDKRPGCYPTAQQELLLRAALLEGKDGLDAWRDWLREGDVDQLDEASNRLLPLLYKGPLKNEMSDQCLSKIKRVYQRTFHDNQLIFYKTADVLREFQKAGIEIMLLKGAALAVLHYKHIGMRPMRDLDVLVPTGKANEAIELLTRLGWQPMLKAPHSQGFQNSNGGEMDLHWHALLELSEKDSDDDFWNGAVRADIHDVQLLASNPTDLLFQVCIHGLRWDETVPIRWIADASMILQSGSEIDWPRMLRHGRKHRLILPLKEALQYLKKLLNAPIPAAVLTELEAAPVPLSERLDYASKSCPHFERGPLLTSWAYYREYGHWARSHGVTNKATGFALFLRDLWGANNVWQVPFLLAKGVVRRCFKHSKNQSL